MRAARTTSAASTSRRIALRCAAVARRRRALGVAVFRYVHVAETPNRLDVARIGGVGLDQFAQTRYLNVDRAIEHFVVATTREQHQLFARERLTRMLDEHPDQRKLSRGERRHL